MDSTNIEYNGNKFRTTEELIDYLKKDSEHWKFVAAYLASCHAASLESLPKSGSKSERRRLTSICKKAAAYLRGNETPPWLGHHDKNVQIESEIKRCEEAAKEYGLE
jgi:hypothetical protein